jgi:hypothetical protein
MQRKPDRSTSPPAIPSQGSGLAEETGQKLGASRMHPPGSNPDMSSFSSRDLHRRTCIARLPWVGIAAGLKTIT